MCGIFGLIQPQKKIDIELCCSQINMLTHRGPDGLGVLIGNTATGQTKLMINPNEHNFQDEGGKNNDIFLGHRRLSILDLSTSAMQPMKNEDGRVWVVFNGEIYNFAELRKELLNRGHVFFTDHSDTEVLVHGYEEWGENLTERLRGMFAFVIVDFHRRIVFLARDRFGEKPLYYYSTQGKFVFASELKAIIKDSTFQRKISASSLYDYLRFGYVPSPESIYSGIKKLKAAEKAIVSFERLEDVRPERYWNLEYNRINNQTQGALIEAFEEKVNEAVKLRMLSDVPLGTFLSGGLDSSMVVKSMSHVSPLSINTFSAGFTAEEFDETIFAEIVAGKYSTNHFVETLSPIDLLNTVPIITECFDEPFADSSAIPTYLVSKMAKKKVTVALSGDGGDELLAGYLHYRVFNKLAILDKLPAFLVNHLAKHLSCLWPESLRGKGLIKLFASGSGERYKRHWGDPSLLKLLSNPVMTTGADAFDQAWDNGTLNLVDKMCHTDIRFFIPEDGMTKIDRASMAVSLEVRAPLLDHELFELASSLPFSMIFNGDSGKLPFKEILQKDLGKEFINRRKKGFSVPLGRWFRQELNGELKKTLFDKNGITMHLFSHKGIQNLISEHECGSRDQSHKLWRLYMLEKWHNWYGGD